MERLRRLCFLEGRGVTLLVAPKDTERGLELFLPRYVVPFDVLVPLKSPSEFMIVSRVLLLQL